MARYVTFRQIRCIENRNNTPEGGGVLATCWDGYVQPGNILGHERRKWVIIKWVFRMVIWFTYATYSLSNGGRHTTMIEGAKSYINRQINTGPF